MGDESRMGISLLPSTVSYTPHNFKYNIGHIFTDKETCIKSIDDLVGLAVQLPDVATGFVHVRLILYFAHFMQGFSYFRFSITKAIEQALCGE